MVTEHAHEFNGLEWCNYCNSPIIEGSCPMCGFNGIIGNIGVMSRILKAVEIARFHAWLQSVEYLEWLQIESELDLILDLDGEAS